MTAEIPPGFVLVDYTSPFLDVNGPVYIHADTGFPRFGLRVEARHCNLSGLVHGGMLATLADFAMGRALARQRENLQRLVTLSLGLDYVGTAAVGTWIEAWVQIRKHEGSVVFATCDIRERERIVLVANGVFKFLVRREKQERHVPT